MPDEGGHVSGDALPRRRPGRHLPVVPVVVLHLRQQRKNLWCHAWAATLRGRVGHLLLAGQRLCCGRRQVRRHTTKRDRLGGCIRRGADRRRGTLP